jgi:DNA-binding Xre family transcriptional regulator
MDRTVKNAQKMVIALLKNMTQTKLSETSGINQVTLASLKNGKASRISEKVWSRLVKAYDGTVPLQKKRTTTAISPQPESQTLVETIDGIVAQLEALKKQIKPLEELRALLMKMY